MGNIVNPKNVYAKLEQLKEWKENHKKSQKEHPVTSVTHREKKAVEEKEEIAKRYGISSSNVNLHDIYESR